MITEAWMEDIGTEVKNKNKSIETQTALITSDTEANRNLILNILKGIDFSESRLPEEFLNKKKDPRQSYGNFQMKVMQLIRLMENDTSVFEMDITDIDRYLFLMAKILSAAVKSGFQGTAAAARKCLTDGFIKVRSNCTVLQDEASRRQYLEKAVEYLNNCYLYISVRNMMDITNHNLQKRKKSMDEEVRHLEDAKDHVIDMMLANPELVGQLQNAFRTTYIMGGQLWSPYIRNLYEMLVQFRISESKLQYEGMLLNTETEKMFFYRNVSEKLNSLITNIPAPEDVNLMEKFGNIINSSMDEAERVDRESVRLDEMMASFENGLQAMVGDPDRQAAFAAKTYQSLEETVETRRKKHGDPSVKEDF